MPRKKFIIKITVIYGANASGKTNLIAAALAFCRFIFRKDQIWFTEKNKFGETELFSASDFNAPKFDAQPLMKEIEFIYGT